MPHWTPFQLICFSKGSYSEGSNEKDEWEKDVHPCESNDDWSKYFYKHKLVIYKSGLVMD